MRSVREHRRLSLIESSRQLDSQLSPGDVHVISKVQWGIACPSAAGHSLPKYDEWTGRRAPVIVHRDSGSVVLRRYQDRRLNLSGLLHRLSWILVVDVVVDICRGCIGLCWPQ